MRSSAPACSTDAGVNRRPKRAARRPPVSKKKARRCRRMRSSGRPASRTIFAGRPVSISRANAHAISGLRRPSTNNRSRASVIRASGSIRVPAAAMSAPSGVRMSRSTTMAGSNRRVRSVLAGAMPGTGSGSSSFCRARSRACVSSLASSPERCISRSCNSICSSRSGSATGQVAPRTPKSFADVRMEGPRPAGRQGRGKQHGGGSRHRRASPDSPARTSSGPTSGPFRPSQGRSGRAMARPRIRSAGTGPISA